MIDAAVVEAGDVAGAAAAPAPDPPPTEKRSPKVRFAIPDGWMARGFTFEVSWPTDPVARARVRSQFGARRFAYNWALAQVKADLGARKLDPTHQSVPWNLYALRKRFNAEKSVVAPWWQENPLRDVRSERFAFAAR